MPLNRHQVEGHHSVQLPPKSTSAFGKRKRNPPPTYFDQVPYHSDAQVGYGAGIFLTPRTGEIHRSEADAPLRTPRSALALAPPPVILPMGLTFSERLRRLDELQDSKFRYKDDCSERGAMTERSTEAPQSYRSLASMGRKGIATLDGTREDARLTSSERRPERAVTGLDLSASALASHQTGHATTYQSSDAPLSYRCLVGTGGQWAAVSDSASGTRTPASQSVGSVDWSTVARDLDIPLDLGPSEEILLTYRSISASQSSEFAREEVMLGTSYDYPSHARELADVDDHALRIWAKENVIQAGSLPKHPAASSADNDDSSAQLGAGAVMAALGMFFVL